MRIDIATIENNNAISEVQAAAANKVVGGLEVTVDANSIGITSIGGLKGVKSFWANSSVAGIVTPTSAQSEANWNGGIIA